MFNPITLTVTTTALSHASYDELVTVAVGPNGRKHVSRREVSITDLMTWQRENGNSAVAVVQVEVPWTADNLQKYYDR